MSVGFFDRYPGIKALTGFAIAAGILCVCGVGVSGYDPFSRDKASHGAAKPGDEASPSASAGSKTSPKPPKNGGAQRGFNYSDDVLRRLALADFKAAQHIVQAHGEPTAMDTSGFTTVTKRGGTPAEDAINEAYRALPFGAPYADQATETCSTLFASPDAQRNAGPSVMLTAAGYYEAITQPPSGTEISSDEFAMNAYTACRDAVAAAATRHTLSIMFVTGTNN